MANGTQSGFDVDAARKAGYSDDEILQHLTSTRNFDVDGATKAGYSTQEIIQHLSTTAPPQAVPTKQPTKYLPGRTFGMDVARGMGLDADRIKAAEDSGGQSEALKEIGSQVFEGLKGLVRDPLSPITGAASNFEQAVKSGSPGQIVGALSGILGGAESAEKIPKAAGATREAIGGAIHTPEGELRPGVKLTSQLAGGAAGTAVGAELGHPYAGGVLGYKAGPAITEGLFPEPKSLAEAREQAARYQSLAEDVMNRGREQARLDRQAQLETQRQARAELLAKRGTVVGKQPIGPEAPEPTPPPAFPGATPTNVPVGNAPLPTVQNPPGRLTPFGQPQLVSKFTPAEPGRIQSPESPAPPINKTYVSYSAADLMQLARRGDLNAVRELIRNPRGIKLSDIPNVGYLMEPGRPGRVYGGPTGQ